MHALCMVLLSQYSYCLHDVIMYEDISFTDNLVLLLLIYISDHTEVSRNNKLQVSSNQ